MQKDLYGVRVTGREVLLGESVPIPTIAEPFMKALRKGV